MSPAGGAKPPSTHLPTTHVWRNGRPPTKGVNDPHPPTTPQPLNHMPRHCSSDTHTTNPRHETSNSINFYPWTQTLPNHIWTANKEDQNLHANTTRLDAPNSIGVWLARVSNPEDVRKEKYSKIRFHMLRSSIRAWSGVWGKFSVVVRIFS